MEEIYDERELRVIKDALELTKDDLILKPQIKTIVFDLGGVVFTDGSMLAVKKIKNALKLKQSDYKAIEDCFNNDPGTIGRMIRLGLITLDEFVDEFAARLDLNKTQKKMLRHLWFSSYVPNYLMKDILKKLSKKYRLVIFSGNVRERIKYMSKRYKNIFKYFDDAVYSFDYGKNKRDMTFYEELLKHIDCEPEEAILIDDSTRNIKRAKLMGMKGIHYTYSEHFLERLEKLGVEITL